MLPAPLAPTVTGMLHDPTTRTLLIAARREELRRFAQPVYGTREPRAQLRLRRRLPK
jgi:hypothetical protein